MRAITWMAVVACALTLCGLVLIIQRRGPQSSPPASAAASPPVTEPPSASHAAVSSPRFVANPPEHHDELPSVAEAPAPAPTMSADEERAQKISWLKATGPGRDDLLDQATSAGRAWDKLARDNQMRAAFGAWECYRGGCYGTAVHDADATVDDLTREISQSAEFRDWNGAKMRSGPVARDDGKVEVTWVLFTPPEERGGATASPPG